jgi:3-oxoacyl-[acyl-carrier protein] reductase
MNHPVVLITGASGGLGQALLHAFGNGGWRIAAGARTPPPPPPLDSLCWFQIDVTQKAEIEKAVEEIILRWGRIDCLINNAGMTADSLSWKITDEIYEKVAAVNLKGAFFCMQAASMQMIKQRNGHIINIGSYAGRRGAAGQAHYAASKAGLVALGESLAKEIGSRNVRVNTVLPGLLPTRMTAALTSEQMQNLTAENVLRRTTSLEEVASFTAFLAKMQNVSGQVFQLDSRIGKWT